MTVDNFEMSVHHGKLREIRALVEAELGSITEFIFDSYRYDPDDLDPVAPLSV